MRARTCTAPAESVPISRPRPGRSFRGGVSLAVWEADRLRAAPRVELALCLGAMLTFLALTFVTQAIVGREVLIYYHHEIAVLVVTATACVVAGVEAPGRYLDATALGLGACLAIGRLGCLAAGLLPRPPGAARRRLRRALRLALPTVAARRRLVPVPAIESALVAAIVVVGLALVADGAAPGAAFVFYVDAYAVVRFFLEELRGDSTRRYAHGLSEAQWISLALVLGTALLALAGVTPGGALTLVAPSLICIAAAVLARRARRGRGDVLHPRHAHELAGLAPTRARRRARRRSASWSPGATPPARALVAVAPPAPALAAGGDGPRRAAGRRPQARGPAAAGGPRHGRCLPRPAPGTLMEHSHEDTQTTAEPAATNEPAGAAGPGSELLRDTGAGLSSANLALLQRAAGNQSVLALLRSVAPPTGRHLAREGEADRRGTEARRRRRGGRRRPRAGGHVPRRRRAADLRRRRQRARRHELFVGGLPVDRPLDRVLRGRSADEVQAALAQYAPGGGRRARARRRARRDRRPAGREPSPRGAAALRSRTSRSCRPSPAAARRPRRWASSARPRGGARRAGAGAPARAGGRRADGPLLGADVSHARVHSDELGARIAERHGAAAVAVGSHVAFARGAYEPGTPLGDALIAHELAHVAQYDETAVVAPAREAEREADAAGVAALAQRGVAALRRSVKSGLALRRCGGKEWPTTPGVFGKAPEKVREGFDRDGNDPGKLPAVSHDKDTSRFSFDADGDQVKELNAEITVMELHASGAASGSSSCSSRTPRRAG